MRLFLVLFVLAASVQADWRLAFPGWNYEFPRDHQNHPEFKTEWWYFTGNLKAADGRPFGYQLTFFRQGIIPLDSDIIPLSHFVTNSVKFAHFALSDLSAGKFHFAQKVSRGAYGEAGFGRGKQLAWIEEWSCTLDEDGTFMIKGAADDFSLELTLRPITAGDSRSEWGESKSRGRGESVALLFVYAPVQRGGTATRRRGDRRVRVELVRS